MAGLTISQIVTLAAKQAKVPGYLEIAGQYYNLLMQELCMNYDLEINKVTDTFDMSTAAPPASNALSDDWLRSKMNDVFYTIQGVNYFPIQRSQQEYDRFVQQAGMQGYPTDFYVDVSVSPSLMYFWPAPSGAYPITARYFKSRPDVASPETSTDYPWFPQQNIILQILTGRLMLLSDDERASRFLADDDNIPEGGFTMLRKYLKLEGDKSAIPNAVTLDRRRFGTSFDRLRNTKTLGW